VVKGSGQVGAGFPLVYHRVIALDLA
jgi:hypothetical protein